VAEAIRRGASSSVSIDDFENEIYVLEADVEALLYPAQVLAKVDTV
jgi:hypothetical protein